MEEIPIEIVNLKNKWKKPDLTISRVPKSTLDYFFSLCTEEEFSNDRGMCLKHIIDIYRGVMISNEDLILRIQSLEEEMNKLKLGSPKDKDKEIRMCNGRIIKIGKGE